MKKINLLTPLILTTSVVPLVSCGPYKPIAQQYADWIFNPADSEKTPEQTLGGATLSSKIMEYDEDALKGEIIYDIFGFFNKKGFMHLNAEDSFRSLYLDSKVGILTNVGKFEANKNPENESLFNFTFLGYISMQFAEDYPSSESPIYKTNDYVMITFDVKNFVVQIDDTNVSLIYAYSDSNDDPEKCVGVVKERYGVEELTYSIESINTASDYSGLPSNSQNWVK